MLTVNPATGKCNRGSVGGMVSSLLVRSSMNSYGAQLAAEAAMIAGRTDALVCTLPTDDLDRSTYRRPGGTCASCQNGAGTGLPPNSEQLTIFGSVAC